MKSYHGKKDLLKDYVKGKTKKPTTPDCYPSVWETENPLGNTPYVKESSTEN
jgi:hypothetical protein